MFSNRAYASSELIAPTASPLGSERASQANRAMAFLNWFIQACRLVEMFWARISRLAIRKPISGPTKTAASAINRLMVSLFKSNDA